MDVKSEPKQVSVAAGVKMYMAIKNLLHVAVSKFVLCLFLNQIDFSTKTFLNQLFTIYKIIIQIKNLHPLPSYPWIPLLKHGYPF